MILAILLSLGLSVGVNEAMKPTPCQRVLIKQERTAEGVVEQRVCKDGEK